MGMVLTYSRGNMGSVPVGTLLGEYIMEVVRQISGRMRLEQVV
jgi:hypothetical protein